MSKARNIRKRKTVDEDSGSDSEDVEEQELRKRLEATRDLQKHRSRGQGPISTTPPLQRRAARILDETVCSDLRLGLRSRLHYLQTGGKRDDEFMAGYIKEQAKEAKDDGDPEREKYITEQLNKRLGRSDQEDSAEVPAGKEDNVYAIPVALRAQKTNQEDVSAWMTGIVEVPLSVSHKLKNIEETEDAKKQLLQQSGAHMLEEEEAKELNSSEPDKLVRVSYPLRFGKQTDKEEDWRQRALQKSLQPRERRKKRSAT